MELRPRMRRAVRMLRSSQGCIKSEASFASIQCLLSRQVPHTTSLLNISHSDRFPAMLSLLAFALALSPNLGVAVGSCTPCKGGTWKTLAPIPIEPRQEHTTVAISADTLAILGGVVPAANLVTTTDIMQLYDIASDKWSFGPSLPLAMNHANAAVVDGKVYLLGGLAVASDGAWRGVANSWVYDPMDNEWTPISPMLNATARGSAAIGVHGKKIYLAGGMTTLDVAGSGYQDSVTTVSVYDTIRGTWRTLPQKLPEGRDHAGGAVVNSTLYVLGGRYFGSSGNRDTVYSLDLDNHSATWQTSSARMPTARGGVSAATIGTKVYVFGGEGNDAEGSNGVFNETEVFDTTTETWEVLRPMKLPRHGTSAVAVGERIYIPGGGIYENAGPVNTTDVFCPRH